MAVGGGREHTAAGVTEDKGRATRRAAGKLIQINAEWRQGGYRRSQGLLETKRNERGTGGHAATGEKGHGSDVWRE